MSYVVFRSEDGTLRLFIVRRREHPRLSTEDVATRCAEAFGGKVEIILETKGPLPVLEEWKESFTISIRHVVQQRIVKNRKRGRPHAKA